MSAYWPVEVKLSAYKLGRGTDCYVCSADVFARLCEVFRGMYVEHSDESARISIRADMSDEELDILNAMLDTPDPIDAGMQRGGF